MARFRAFASDSEDGAAISDSSSTHSSRRHAPQKIVKPIPKAISYTSSSSSSSSSSLSSDSIEDEANDSDEDSIMDEDDLRPASERGARDSRDEPAPWPQQLDLEPHRVHVMQTSLFRMPELAKSQQKEASGFLKHRRSPDNHAEPKEVPPRASFAHPRTQPPARKYVRVSSSASIAATHECVYLDAGLCFGRSFRVGWAFGDKLAHVGELGVVTNPSPTQGANSSIVKVTTPHLTSAETPDLLQHLLSNTPIQRPSLENGGSPYITPNHDLTFSSFASLFSAQDKSHTASVFRLGHALFDPLDLHLGPSVPADTRNRILALRRVGSLSTWLARAVSPVVDDDLKAHASPDSSKIAFLHLTGNQVEKAVDTLTNSGNIRLATLISQVPGDAEFRADIREQLQVWRDEKVDIHMGEDIRKLYALAAGEVDYLEGSSRKEDVNILKGLDWLRTLGLQLWFASFLDTPLRETFEDYEQLINGSTGRAAFPTPWYSKKSGKSTSVTDGLFSVMKLALSPSMTLESTLNPLSFTPNPRDYKIPWFLYIILSRCLRIRDFTDREPYEAAMDESTDSSQDIGGFSQAANALTVNFASQLQQQGHIQEAAFVLLFLEDDLGRERAIKDLLARSAPELDEWKVAGLHGSLKIPQEWIDEAKATHALYQGDMYLAYELFVKAGVHKTAHELAINYLSPEAILRDDLELLSSLFTILDESLVNDFSVGGQLFIDYVAIVTRVPELRESQQLEDLVLDASEMTELESLSGRIPKLISILPDVLRDKPGGGERCSAALSRMLSRLLDCLDPSRPVKIDIQPGIVDEAARLKHIHSSAYGSFLKTIASMA